MNSKRPSAATTSMASAASTNRAASWERQVDKDFETKGHIEPQRQRVDPSFPPSEEFKLSVLVVSGFPRDSPDYRKNQIIVPFLEAGGSEAWVNPATLVVAYRNAARASEALRLGASSFLSCQLLSDYSGDFSVEATEIGKQLYDSIKPERDATVASRFISSALGMKPVRSAQGASASSKPRTRQPSPPREDAWD